MRRPLSLMAVGMAIALVGPSAHADDVEPVEQPGSFNVFDARGVAAGSVTYDGTLSQGAAFYKVVPNCTFAGVLTPNNTLIVEFAGTAQSSTNNALKAPQLTYIKCTIRQAANPALETSADLLANAPVSATAGSTLLDTSGPKEWPVAPITICSEAIGLFGNADPVIVRIPESCKQP